ncbi:hypothetical protein BDV95DRAFT_578585 [Massariosphaeria phaeospora]|uniref:BTB domain-containing protein n=1 Tax=Massariosphaeria phaeospora TaxID=100035 RepID=A0A7C8I2K0_9PLEO|nr:hypothetical protein BDV95DRAFT_578585 [Massariosphaeria phaeospora]
MATPKSVCIPKLEAIDITGPVVQVVVKQGESPVTVSAHKSVLCSSSQFFQTAAKKEWAELRDEPHTITFEYNPELFQAYIHWLYIRTLPIPVPTAPGGTLQFLARVYVLGEELMDSNFKNAVLDTVIAECKGSYLCQLAVSIIYEGTTEASPLRRLLVDIYADQATALTCWTSQFKGCPKDFLVDVMTAMVKLRPATAKAPWKKCSGSYRETV